LDNAIEPDKLGTIFSGSAVVDWENTSGFGSAGSKALVCVYTAAGEPFTQCIAYSTDGRKFTKYDKNPVLGHLAGSNRDPKVIWYAPEKKWVMALFLDGDTYAIFESKDLKSWTKLHDVKFPGHGECPDFFPMGVDGNKKTQKWVFTAANGDYLIGAFDGKAFKPEGDAIRADYGANYYAVQTYSDIPANDGRRIQIAWMNGGKYPDMPFNQQMSFPCEMTLRSFPEGLRICRLPVREIKSIHGKKHAWKDEAVKPGGNLLKDVSGDLFDIQLQVDLAGAREFGIKCRGEAVTYSAEKKTLTSLGREAPVEAANGRITFRILVDRTSIEVFANDGKAVMTSCFLPDSKNAGLELFSEGGSPKILSMTVYELKSAWPMSKAGEVKMVERPKQQNDDWFLLTSHVVETDGLHLAVSPDGLKWQVVNGDKSVLKPTIPEVFRDPSIAKDESGAYHLIWTIAWGCGQHKGIGYAFSKDLVNWSEQRIIPVMENEPKTEFIWAPELFWDSGKKEWMIHWSSSVTDKYPETLALFDGHSNPRIYYTTTKDFKTFKPSKLLFNPDCLAIDSYVYRGDDKNYYVFFKADRKEEPKRGILVAKAPAPDGPYAVDPKMITGLEEGWAEGPCAVKVGEKTRLYYAPPNDFGAYESTDMKNWTSIRKEMVPPGGYRHGTVIRISAEEVKSLLNHEYKN
jgi:sucrose-6-phosphate hydrolase SacC (GH32 family)